MVYYVLWYDIENMRISILIRDGLFFLTMVSCSINSSVDR